jgi:hypothetical protein
MGQAIQRPTMSDNEKKKHKERVSGPKLAKSKKRWDTGAYIAANTATS